MKLRILASITAIILLAGCRSYPVAQQGGKEDMAYLLFVSSDEYKNKTVNVKLDDNTAFEAKVVATKRAKRKGIAYGVATGRRKIIVTNGEKTIYEKELFLSTQETKQITLP